jgi:2-polyprenyl-3-methyl-5-hydroxy-6-metoxy-1,4-benzoquinol methylase
MNQKEQMDSIYRELALDKIPWNLKEPPEVLTELVDSKWILPCKALDLGCGAGNYAVWFASKGFQITGIDISAKAIELANLLAGENGVQCHFIAHDLLGELEGLPQPFDFAYDWEVLHHIFPQDREKYIANVHRLIRPGGKYFSVCFSETDSDFGGEGKYRKTPLGTILYFSSEHELKELFEPKFHIQKLYTSKIAGKYGPHEVIVAHMERRNNAKEPGGYI